MGLLRLSMLCGVGFVCFLALGCNREEPIKAYQAPKEAAHVNRERIEWKTPAEWVEWPGDEEQTYAGFTLEDLDPLLELTVTYLGREAPGAANVQANVNRWERQLRMPASSKEEVRRLVNKVIVDERPLFMVDLMGPAGVDQKRILGAMVLEGDRVWFFKLMGATARIEKHKKEFDQFVSSLKFNGPRDMGPQRGMKDELVWTKPSGWQYGPEGRVQIVPRVVTVLAGDGRGLA